MYFLSGLLNVEVKCFLRKKSELQTTQSIKVQNSEQEQQNIDCGSVVQTIHLTFQVSLPLYFLVELNFKRNIHTKGLGNKKNLDGYQMHHLFVQNL